MTATDPAGRPAAAENPLVEASLLPTRFADRSIGRWSYIWIWVGIAVIIATYSLGATGVSGGLDLSTVILTIMAANLVIGAFMLLTADIGTEHGLSFAVYLRAPFGVHGTHLPAVTRGVVAAIWFGIQTYLGALALNGIGEYFLGFSNWFAWYVAFAILQVANTALGIKSVERLAALAAPAIIAISIWMYFTLAGIADLKGLNIWNHGLSGELSVIVLFVANMGFWATMAIDIPNLTRYLKAEASPQFARRNRNVFAAQLLALPITQGLIAGLGAVSMIATGNWNPIEVIQADASGISLLVLLLLVVLAQWSTNNSANLIPAALTFVNLAPRFVSYPLGVALAGVVGTLSFPWLILDNLFAFLGYCGAFLSSIGGIMVADYYLLRRRRLNVPALYQISGQYRYWNGFNLPGLFAWLAGGAVAAWFVDYGLLIGCPLGAVLYLMLANRRYIARYPQAELSGPASAWLASSVGEEWVSTSAGEVSKAALRH